MTMTMKIVVGVDGSEPAHRALEWCASHAPALDAEVIAVHAIEMPVITDATTFAFSFPQLSLADRERMHEVVEKTWCEPLTKAGVRFRAVVVEGNPSLVIMETAKSEGAELIVTGRRGRGAFTEFLLGSTSNALTHLADRPLVIIP